MSKKFLCTCINTMAVLMLAASSTTSYAGEIMAVKDNENTIVSNRP